MGTSSSRATKQQMIAQQVPENGESSLSKFHISHDTKTRIISTFCTLFERLMREQFVSFSDTYYDKKFK